MRSGQQALKVKFEIIIKMSSAKKILRIFKKMLWFDTIKQVNIKAFLAFGLVRIRTYSSARFNVLLAQLGLVYVLSDYKNTYCFTEF